MWKISNQIQQKSLYDREADPMRTTQIQSTQPTDLLNNTKIDHLDIQLKTIMIFENQIKKRDKLYRSMAVSALNPTEERPDAVSVDFKPLLSLLAFWLLSLFFLLFPSQSYYFSFKFYCIEHFHDFVHLIINIKKYKIYLWSQ